MTLPNGAQTLNVHDPNKVLIFSRQLSPGCETVFSLSGDAAEQWKKARAFEVGPVVRAGGALLALCAGFVNAVAIRVFAEKVSHSTGTWTNVGMGLADTGIDAVFPACLILSFVVGSALTGCLVAKDTPHFGMALYDLVLLIESALLVLTAFVYQDKHLACCLASTACGMQNGMCTQWGGAVIRTTHVTGLFTDVGLCIGRSISKILRKKCGREFDNFDKAFLADDLSKLSVLLSIAASFALGAAVGTHLHQTLNQWAFLIPAAVVGIVGILCLTYRVVVEGRKVFSDDEQECIDIPPAMQGAILAMQPDLAHPTTSSSAIVKSFAAIGSFRRQTSTSTVTVSRALAQELQDALGKSSVSI